jgi:hypothetical protein
MFSMRKGHKFASAMVATLRVVIALVAMSSTWAAGKGGPLSSAAKGPIPYGKRIQLSPHGLTPGLFISSSTNSLYANTHEAVAFLVVDKGAGRVALFGNGGFLSVDPFGVVSLRRGAPAKAEIFRWIETITGEFTLLSLNSHQYLRVDTATGAVWANGVHAHTNLTGEIVFDWKFVTETPNEPPTREPTQ